MLRLSASLAFVALVSANDCHLSGMSKTTYATSSEAAIKGLTFLIRAFNMTVAEDSNAGNHATCPAGTSGQEEEWIITQGRAETVANLTTAGTCYIALSPDTNQPSNAELPVSSTMTPATEVDGDCTYIELGNSLTNVTFDYAVPTHDSDTCCKACAADERCTSAAFVAGEEEIDGMFVGECFGLHITALPGHATSPGLSVEQVEAYFSGKLAGHDRFDWFHDYNAALYAPESDFDDLLAHLDSLGISYLSARWSSEGYDDATVDGDQADYAGYSAFVHVPDTQLVIELLTPASATLSARAANGEVSPVLEPRMTRERYTDLASQAASGDYSRGTLFTAGISRAASNMSAVDEFYLEGFGARLSMSLSDETSGLTKHCFVINGTSADACFVTRPDETTTGEFKPLDFENSLNAAHAYWLNGYPDCNMDRWSDNHFAIDTDLAYDDFMEWITNHREVQYTCSCDHGKGAHYVFDPTGWGVQMNNAEETTILPGCCETDDGDDDASYLYWCDGGTCRDDAALL